ncbi:MAG: V-type ATP synthase subunit E [Actinobacteria bacterium]|nr:V-type ATP synthase subunit E [Actinomycetota bacterium]MCG2806950.1 V-type ATP synthase subunit E [Coriobacteriia bacterium]
MALEDIFRALEDQAQDECDQILRVAREQAEAIAEDAADQAQTIRTNRVDDAERTTRKKASRTVNSARLESKKRVAAVKEAAVSESFDRASTALSSVRGRSDYAAIFKALAEEASTGLEGELEVWVDPADEALAKGVIAELGLSAVVRPEIKSAGGLVMTIDEGKISRRNTLEDRLEKVRLMAQADVAEILFS